MAYPTKYTRQFGFDSWQATHTADHIPGHRIDNDLNAVQISIDGIVEFLKLHSRSDGALANGSVTLDSLSSEVIAAINAGDAGGIDAGGIEFTPAGNIAATDVQSAIEELDTEKLAASSYTAADVLAKLLTVDGAGSGINADMLDGMSSAAFAEASHTHSASQIASGTFDNARISEASVTQHAAAIEAALTLTASQIANTPAGGVAATTVQAAIDELDTEKLAASSYTAADVLSKLLTVDGAGSGLDADLLDGNSSDHYLAASSYTAADVLSKLLTVDGAGSGLDADLLDGNQASAFILGSLLTTRGDLIRRGASGPERFAAVTANTFVGGDGTDVTTRTAAQVKTSLGFPTSTTDNTVPRFDSTAGNLQTSGVSIDDSNNISAAGFLTTATATLNDDTATSFTVPGSAQQLEVLVLSISTTSGIVIGRATSSVFAIKIGGGANLAVTTGVLTGTTGSDGNLTISFHTDGMCYLENRVGATATVYLSFRGR